LAVVSFGATTAVLAAMIYTKYSYFRGLFKYDFMNCIFWLTIANLVDSLANIISPLFLLDPENETACVIVGAFEMISIYSSSAWLCLISVGLYRYFRTQDQPPTSSLRNRIINFFFGFGVPIISTIIALSRGWIGNNDNLHCSIESINQSENVAVLYAYGVLIPRGITIICTTIYYYLMYRRIKNIPDNTNDWNLCLQTALFPLVYFISSIWMIVDALTLGDYFGIALVAHILRRSIGLFDAIIYVYNPFVREHVVELKRLAEIKRQAELKRLEPFLQNMNASLVN